MDMGELEKYLQGGAETPAFEVKTAMPWDEKSLAKDILAMSNLRDGGTIVIGIADGTFERVGVTEDIIRSYNLDIMRDQMAKWADPSVSFNVRILSDERHSKKYVAIEVATFREVPTICRKNGAEVRAGCIYYRTTDKRVQSAPIDNSTDMRDLIVTAAARVRTVWRHLGLSVTSESEYFQQQLDDELGGL